MKKSFLFFVTSGLLFAACGDDSSTASKLCNESTGTDNCNTNPNPTVTIDQDNPTAECDHFKLSYQGAEDFATYENGSELTGSVIAAGADSEALYLLTANGNIYRAKDKKLDALGNANVESPCTPEPIFTSTALEPQAENDFVYHALDWRVDQTVFVYTACNQNAPANAQTLRAIHVYKKLENGGSIPPRPAALADYTDPSATISTITPLAFDAANDTFYIFSDADVTLSAKTSSLSGKTLKSLPFAPSWGPTSDIAAASGYAFAVRDAFEANMHNTVALLTVDGTKQCTFDVENITELKGATKLKVTANPTDLWLVTTGNKAAHFKWEAK